MKLKDLRALLDSVKDEPYADDIEIVISGSDHSYERAHVQIVTAETDMKRGGYLGEYHGDANMAQGSSTTRVLLVS